MTYNEFFNKLYYNIYNKKKYNVSGDVSPYIDILEKKQKNHMRLGKGELVFIYQIGNQTDPTNCLNDYRIECLRKSRNHIEDLNTVFEGINKLYCDVNLEYLEYIDGVEFPPIINGSLDLRLVQMINNVKLPVIVKGDLNLYSLVNGDDILLSEYVGRNLFLCSLLDIKSVIYPKVVRKKIFLDSVKDYQEEDLPSSNKGLVLSKPEFRDYTIDYSVQKVYKYE